MAHVLATLHSKRVLLVDNDKQGNTSKAFGPFLRRQEHFGRADCPAAGPAGGHQEDPVREYRRNARKYDLDLGEHGSPDGQHPPPTNAPAVRPERDCGRKLYDFCIIDNAPDINIQR